MAKMVTEGFLADTVNGIKINTSIPCNSANYEKYNKREVKYIAIHYTGNVKDTSKNNAKYFNEATNANASAHLFVDDNEIYQSVAYHDKAWHVGTKNGYKHAEARNMNSIGIEMSTTAGNYTVSETTIKNAAYLCAYLCNLVNITVKDVDTYVIRHYDVTGKECPRQMVRNPNEWIAFKQAVKDILNSGVINSTTTVINTTSNSYPVPTTVLKQGAKGDTVKWLQQALNKIGNYNLAVDGSFGAATLKAVKDYQKNNNLEVDGSVGNLTRASILKSLDNLNNNNNNNDNNEVSNGNNQILDTEKCIWDYCYNKLKNVYGVSGLMGNLYAESGLKPNNLQDNYEKKLGYTDSSYTQAVDSGKYTKFAKDSAGYGLAQWTYLTRKQGLYDYAKLKKVSISDTIMQLEYLFKELESNYINVLKALKNAKTVKSASDIVLTEFEKPADQSNSVKTQRAKYGQVYYDKYAKNTIASNTTNNTTEVNTTNPVITTTTTTSNVSTTKKYRVQIGGYLLQNSANNMAARLKKAGYDSIVVKSGAFYIIQLGIFSNANNAANLVSNLKGKGFRPIIKLV